MTQFISDRLIPLDFLAELHYPPRELQHSMLLSLFNELSGPFNFLNLKLHPDDRGALFAGEHNNRCEILKDKIIIREEMKVVSFDNFCETTMAILQHVCAQLKPPVFIGQQNMVRMLYPLDSAQEANRFLIQSFLHMPEGLAEQVGRPLAGIGLRLVFPPTQQNPSEFQLRIEPFFRDQTQLFLENSGRFFPPFKDLQQARERLHATYEFLKSSLDALF